MTSPFKIQIDIDKVLVTLFCCYAFSMPFELILEILLGIDTIFKPFRILSLLIIGVYGLKILLSNFTLQSRFSTDWLLYCIFIYGLGVSLIRMLSAEFNLGLFLNDSFQLGLHIATFTIYKTTSISKDQANRILNWFILGITTNAIYLVWKFMGNFQGERQPGFVDNPNYTALGILIAAIALYLKSNFKKSYIVKSFYLGWMLFLISAFTIQGSRMAFVAFAVGCIFLFLFSSIQKKIAIVALLGAFLFLLSSGPVKQMNFRGIAIMKGRLSRTIIHGEEDVRIALWRKMVDVLEEKGYVGMGIGQYKANFSKYYTSVPNKLIVAMTMYDYYMSPHNDYLSILADYGLPSLIVYLFFLLVTSWQLFVKAIYEQDPTLLYFYQLSLIMIVVIGLFGFGHENFLHQLYWFTLMFATKTYRS